MAGLWDVTVGELLFCVNGGDRNHGGLQPADARARRSFALLAVQCAGT